MPGTGEHEDPVAIVNDLMHQWKAGVDSHEPVLVAALFTEDALFQGLRPDPVHGTAAIVNYYAGQPRDLRAEFELLTCRRHSPGMIVAYLSVDFHTGDHNVRPTHLTVVLVNEPSGWHIAHYHVSLIP
ncbi:nuclear transport factor 2 family protein [Mycolicibacterium sp. HK-90]|uniref:YybH family protein n=1 Tax=Mycolicibacterium sp. HK-90 TaxID=3056937 RepID=UPI002658DF7D|nr:nuclear transport factor 2 family protein [Mycolicibacterium sp. HK-90]WKG03929.1 nuclear transport factor 2 family protein [Mycolicibacterium sp. HK-90]